MTLEQRMNLFGLIFERILVSEDSHEGPTLLQKKSPGLENKVGDQGNTLHG